MNLAPQLTQRWPADKWRDCHVVVAVSGGADSVALLRTLAEITQQQPARGKLMVAHFNHRLRGADSDADQAWVAQLAENLGLECIIGQADADAALSSEESARNCRYEFLASTAERLGARFVATAHTADDQVETVLMRVLRGSGIDGLAGIPFTRPLSPSVTLVRPMLDIRRADVEASLDAIGQDFRHDHTNAELHFTRNWIRGELLPLVRQRLPGDPDQAILRLAQQAGAWREAFDTVASELATSAVAFAPGQRPSQIVLDREVLAREPAIIVQQVCRQAWRTAGWPEQGMGMSDWQRLAALIADGEAPAITLPGGVEARPGRSSVVLARIAPSPGRP